MKGGVAVAMALLEDLPPRRGLTPSSTTAKRGRTPRTGLRRSWQEATSPDCRSRCAWSQPATALQTGLRGQLARDGALSGQAAHSARPWEGEERHPQAAPACSRSWRAPSARRSRVETSPSTRWHNRHSPGRQRPQRGAGLVRAQLELPLRSRGVDRRGRDPDARARGGGRSWSSPISPRAARPALHNPEVQRCIGLGVPSSAKQAWTDVARWRSARHRRRELRPGKPAQAHQVDEWCEISALAEGHRACFVDGYRREPSVRGPGKQHRPFGGDGRTSDLRAGEVRYGQGPQRSLSNRPGRSPAAGLRQCCGDRGDGPRASLTLGWSEGIGARTRKDPWRAMGASPHRYRYSPV